MFNKEKRYKKEREKLIAQLIQAKPYKKSDLKPAVIIKSEKDLEVFIKGSSINHGINSEYSNDENNKDETIRTSGGYRSFSEGNINRLPSKEELFELRKTLTYQEIADKYSVSKQAVHFKLNRQYQKSPKSITKQQKIFNFIRKFIEENGFSPSLEEIGDAIGTSDAVAYYHVKILIKNGLLTCVYRKYRSLRVA